MKRLSIPKLCLQRRRSLSLNLSFYKRNLSTQMERCVNEVDVVIVGAGPAGLSASIKLKQLDPNLSVVILEKASQIGGHSVSGAVLEPTALNELIPNWADDLEEDCPVQTKVIKDEMKLLTQKYSLPLPIPPALHNEGNYIISISEFVRWLGRQAEALGVEIFPGFGGSELVYDSLTNNSVIGVATNDVGLDKSGAPKDNFERGMELRGRRGILLAEGCHGSLSKEAIEKYNLRSGRSHQTYGLGLKEVWEVSDDKFEGGKVGHSVGWPLQSTNTYGGGFMYHYGKNLVSLGLVVGLDYSNPNLNPYKEFQQMKLHPYYKSVLEGGKCIAYGARALNEGGWQSIPKLNFPGGALIGCSAGFVNVPKIKGIHTAMKSGILAAESIVKDQNLESFEDNLRNSWMGKELYKVRNVRPAFHTFGGLWGGLGFAGVDTMIFRGRLPFTLSHSEKADHQTLIPVKESKTIKYPKPDGKITFELLESVSRTGTNHEENQPIHLQLKSGSNPQLEHNLPKFGGPEEKFCPAGVYEYVKEDSSASNEMKFQINAQNCIHCKTCDIKDPSQNINWTVPEGGGGPQYTCT